MHTLVTTLDLETRGDGSGSVEGLVVEPLDAMLGLARRHGVRLTLFVEAAGLARVGREGGLGDRRAVDALCRRLESAARGGHELGLHLHPQWTGAVRSGRGFRARGPEALAEAGEEAVDELVDGGHAWVGAIAGRAPRAFRAGGLLGVPRRVLDRLARLGVDVDSSVAPGRREGGWDAAPRDRAGWTFEGDPGRPTPGGRWVELPVATGTAASGRRHLAGRWAAFRGTAWRVPTPGPSRLDLCGWTAEGLQSLVATRPEGPVVAIGHPKTWSGRAAREVERWWASHRGPTATLSEAAAGVRAWPGS